MFGFFFHPGPVSSFEDAKKSDLPRFRRFFHAMLCRGVYLAPSQFEAGFLSIVHDENVIAATISAVEQAFRTW